MSWFGTYYRVYCEGCNETVLYDGYSKLERDKVLNSYGNCGKCHQRDERIRKQLEDQKAQEKSKQEKSDSIKNNIEDFKTTMSNVDNTIKVTEEVLAKEKDNLGKYTAKTLALQKKIQDFPVYKKNRLEEYSIEIKLPQALDAYNRDRNEVNEAITKTGIHSKDVGHFLALTHGLIAATMNTQAETNRLDVALSTFGSLLNKECQDKLTVEYYFQDKNLKQFTPILAKEGYKTLDHLMCDFEKQFERDILTLLDKGIQRQEKQAREDAQNKIKNVTGEVAEKKKKLEKVQHELKELEEEEKNEKEQARVLQIKRLSDDKIKLETSIKTYDRILQQELRNLNDLQAREKERQSKNAGGDAADDEKTPQTDLTGDDLCKFLLKNWGFSDETWDTFKEEGWDDAEDWPEITEEDLKNDLGFTKKPKIKKFLRVVKKWKDKNEKDQKYQKDQEEKNEQEQEAKQSFMHLQSVEIRELKRICLRPGKEEWGRYEKEKAAVIKFGLLQLSPVLGDFFGNMHTAIKQTEDLLNYKKELSGAQVKAIKLKDQNVQKLKAIEWKRKDFASRKRWKEKTKVEIYSGSSKQWIVGTIIEVTADDEGARLTIQYETNDETRTEQVQRYNMNTIRALNTEDEQFDPIIGDEKESPDMNTNLAKQNDNPIAVQSDALIVASVASVSVTNTMLEQFAMSPTTERGLGMAYGVEDCCKQLIKNQGEIRQSVFLAQEILKYKPANMSKKQTIKLWSAVDAGIIRIFDSALKMVKVAAEYFGFFLRFQNSFKFFVSCYANGKDVSLFTSLERLKMDVTDFNLFKNEFSKAVVELKATAMECIGNCVEESIGYLTWEKTQASLKDTETEYLRLRKMYDNRSLELDDVLESYVKETRSMEQLKLFGDRLKSDKQYKTDENAEYKSIDHSNHDEETINTLENVKTNALIISLIIKRYDDNKKYEEIKGIEQDIQNYQRVLRDTFGYTLISNIDESHAAKYGDKMTKKQVISFLRESRNKLCDLTYGVLHYDSLFVTIGAHGSLDSIVCSDGELYKYDSMRLLFESDDAMRSIPRIFLVDACRLDIETEQKKKETHSAVIRGSVHTNSVTLFGTSSGNAVKGGQLSTFFSKCMHENYEKNKHTNDPKKWNNFHQTYRTVGQMIEKNTKDDHPQALIAQEYDWKIEDVTFMPKNISDTERGSKCDNDYLNEQWDVSIKIGADTHMYKDTKIILVFKENKVVFKYNNNKNQTVLKKKEFEIGIDEEFETVYMRFGNGNLIKIECKNIKSAKYWHRKIKPLSR